MKKLFALFILLSFSVLNGCQSVRDEAKPTSESRETIINETPSLEQEIARVNERFEKNREKCEPSKWCTFEYLFRSDHFQFDLAYNEKPSFSGDTINIRYNDTDDPQNSRSLMSIVILEGSESRYFSGLESEEKDVLINGVPATKYVISDCTNYRLTYKDKTYYFLGHEFCAGRAAEKIIGTFQFYETKK